jgi:serine protease AprX
VKIKLLYLLLFISCFTNAQTEVALVYFKDKPNASTYLNNPQLILSEKSLQRRSNQSIQLNETDAPIHQNYVLQLKQVDGVSVLATSKWFNAVYVQADLPILQNLINFSFVSKIKFFNKNLQGVSRKLTTSSTYVSKWDNQNVTSDLLYGNGQNQIQLHNGNLLHNEGFKGNGITIAVFDTGFSGC